MGIQIILLAIAQHSKISLEDKMREVDARPNTGQFVAMWTYNDLPWCDTYKFVGDVLHVYDPSIDDFDVDENEEDHHQYNPKYFVVD
jgi:hypothetical protein